MSRVTWLDSVLVRANEMLCPALQYLVPAVGSPEKRTRCASLCRCRCLQLAVFCRTPRAVSGHMVLFKPPAAVSALPVLTLKMCRCTADPPCPFGLVCRWLICLGSRFSDANQRSSAEATPVVCTGISPRSSLRPMLFRGQVAQ